MKVGFIGLGIMGKPMAKNLLKAGVSLMVYDINHEVVSECTVLGAVSGTPQEIGRACDIVFCILPNGSIVKDVLFGEGGVAEGLTAGKLVCDMSSVLPEESRYCHDKLQEIGVGFVDAPVSGGEPGAIAGTLAIMCGGSEEDFERLQPCFAILGTSSVLIGGPGSGSTAKLANQIIVNLNIAAVSEALMFAAKAGVDPKKVFQAIRGGLAGSAVLEDKAPRMIERDFAPGGSIAINYKDIKNVMQAAQDCKSPVPLSSILFQMMQTLAADDRFGEDHSAIVKYYEKQVNMEV